MKAFPRSLSRAATLLFAVLGATSGGCGTVDLGDNFIPPSVDLDENYFYCVVQPQVISARSCASGLAGEGGMCHSARSALRLSIAAETDPAPACDANGVATGAVPLSYQQNLEAIRFTVLSDPLSSPLYRRPLQLDSHPRAIFDASSMDAMILAQWITSGAP